MSAPAAKAFSPAPRTTTQRSSPSADSSRMTFPSPAHIALLSALRRSGLFSVTVAMTPSQATRTGSGTAWVPIDPADRPQADPRHVGHQDRHQEDHQGKGPAHPADLPERNLGDRRGGEKHGRHWRGLLAHAQ